MSSYTPIETELKNIKISWFKPKVKDILEMRGRIYRENIIFIPANNFADRIDEEKEDMIRALFLRNDAAGAGARGGTYVIRQPIQKSYVKGKTRL